MSKKQKPKIYSICAPCGREVFPNANRKKMQGITLVQGNCLRCGSKNVILIPIRDFKYASEKKGYLWG